MTEVPKAPGGSSSVCSNKTIKMSSFTSSENIHQKDSRPDKSVSNDKLSSVTLNVLTMKARQTYSNKAAI